VVAAQIVSIEELLSRLDRVRRNSSGWAARCPAHDDGNPSLSIREKDGRILLHCFAGCPVEAIVAALGLELRDLYPNGEGGGLLLAVSAGLSGLSGLMASRWMTAGG
jgi:hypothetical protein